MKEERKNKNKKKTIGKSDFSTDNGAAFRQGFRAPLKIPPVASLSEGEVS